MPTRSDEDRCPECGVLMGNVPADRGCATHKAHEAEWKAEIDKTRERLWAVSTWGERWTLDKDRSFAELAAEVEILKRRLRLLQSGSF